MQPHVQLPGRMTLNGLVAAGKEECKRGKAGANSRRRRPLCFSKRAAMARLEAKPSRIRLPHSGSGEGEAPLSKQRRFVN